MLMLLLSYFTFIQSVPKRCIHKVNIPFCNVYTSFWDTLYIIKNYLNFCTLDTKLLAAVSILTKILAGQPGFDSWQEQEIFLLATTSRPALGPPSYLSNADQGLYPQQ
jgi:hypothetical protein